MAFFLSLPKHFSEHDRTNHIPTTSKFRCTRCRGTVVCSAKGTSPFSQSAKEATGSLDEVQVASSVKEWLDRLTELETRKQTVLTTIEGRAG